MPDVILKRFGVSALSKTNKGNALNEEIMINKLTGEFLIKTIDGHIISFDSLSKLQNNISNTMIAAVNNNMKGNMYSVELTDVELPNFVDADINLMMEPLELSQNGFKKILLSLDLDEIEMTNNSSITEHEASVTIKIRLSRAAGENPEINSLIEITKPVSVINSKVIELEDFHSIVIPDLTGIITTLEEIKPHKNAGNIGKTTNLLLHNILIVIE